MDARRMAATNHTPDALTLEPVGGYCRAMTSSAPRALVLALTLLMLLGHVCELPIDSVVDWHVHEGGQAHSHDADADEEQIACDPLPGIQRICGVQADRGPDVAVAPNAQIEPAPLRRDAIPTRESTRLSRRQPLFLLHASFLI